MKLNVPFLTHTQGLTRAESGGAAVPPLISQIKGASSSYAEILLNGCQTVKMGRISFDSAKCYQNISQLT